MAFNDLQVNVSVSRIYMLALYGACILARIGFPSGWLAERLRAFAKIKGVVKVRLGSV